jgi:FHA domain
MDGPYIRVEDSGLMMPLREDVTTVGRGRSVDIHLADPSVSRLHAEIVRRGPYAYVTDLGLSRNGTRVNGRLVARRVLEDGDVLSFGSARCRVFGLAAEELTAEVELRRPAAPELTRRELDVVTSLCRPALSDEAFVAPATAREIAADLVVTEAAVKQHLLRLYQKFRIPEGANRRVRLANEVVALGLVRPLPPAEKTSLADGEGRLTTAARAAGTSRPARPAASPAPPGPAEPAGAAPARPAAPVAAPAPPGTGHAPRLTAVSLWACRSL